MESEGVFLLPPVAGEVGFAAGGLAHALEGGGGDGLGLGLAGADDVDDGSGGLGEFGHILRRDGTGVVGAVGEDHDGLSSLERGGIFDGEQEGVVEGGIVSGDGAAHAADNLEAVGGKHGGAGEIAAVGVEGDLVGVGHGADKIGDGILGEDEAAVHVVAGVEEDEDVGAAQTRNS